MRMECRSTHSSYINVLPVESTAASFRVLSAAAKAVSGAISRMSIHGNVLTNRHPGVVGTATGIPRVAHCGLILLEGVKDWVRE